MLFLVFLIMQAMLPCFPQPAAWDVKGIGGGGAFYRASLNPGNDLEFYVPTDMGTFFHTADFGLSYNELGFQQLQTGGSTGLIRFTNNAGILYALGYNNTDRMNSVYKTTDGGNTWYLLPCISNATAWQAKIQATSLYVDYNNPDRVVFATRFGLYFSNDGGITMTDLSDPDTVHPVNYASGCLFDGNHIYLGAPFGVLVSANGGTSWNMAALTGIPPDTVEYILGFAAAKLNNKVRFFAITVPFGYYWPDEIVSSSGLIYYNFKNIYMLDDFNTGSHWVPRTNGIKIPNNPSCDTCDYLSYIAMSENDINTVYAGGVNDNGQPKIMKTTDAGNTWSQTLHITNNQNIYTGYFGDGGDCWQWWQGFTGLIVSPVNSGKVITSDLGMVMTSSDGGTTWDQAYVNQADQNPMNAPTPKHHFYRGIGLENTVTNTITWSDADNILVGSQDIGAIRSTDGGTSWQIPGFYYNTMYCNLKNPGTGTLYAAASNVHMIYLLDMTDAMIDNSPYSQGEVMSSTDNGFTWVTLHNFQRPVYWIALDPNNPNTMYASVVNHAQSLGGIYVTHDLQDGAASSWTKLPDPPRTEGHPATIVPLHDGKVVCTYSCRYDDNISKFTFSSGVFLYNPATIGWSDVTDLSRMGWFCNDIYIDPNDPTESTWYVGVSSGWGGGDGNPAHGTPNDGGGLFKTVNRGQSWTKILGTSTSSSGGILPSYSGVFSCTINPSNSNQIYLGTNSISAIDGLIVSDNINSSTPTFAVVGDFLCGNPQRIFFNPHEQQEIWVTTGGNGTVVSSTGTGFSEKKAGNSDINIYPNPAGLVINLSSQVKGKNLAIDIYNVLGQLVYSSKPADFHVQIDISGLTEGIYIVAVACGDQKLQKKFIKQSTR